MSAAAAARRGSRKHSESPRRTMTLSHPASTGTHGRCARSGCCSRRSALISGSSILTSAAGVPDIDERPYPTAHQRRAWFVSNPMAKSLRGLTNGKLRTWKGERPACLSASQARYTATGPRNYKVGHKDAPGPPRSLATNRQQPRSWGTVGARLPCDLPQGGIFRFVPEFSPCVPVLGTSHL
jgi:hypothetical protein